MDKLVIALSTTGTFFLLVSFPSIANAYLDPGTGSIILQGIVGAIAVGMATGRLWWYRLKNMFSSKQSSEIEEEGIQGSESEPQSSEPKT